MRSPFLASVRMVIPVVTTAINHHFTLIGHFGKLKYSPTLRFIVFGAIGGQLIGTINYRFFGHDRDLWKSLALGAATAFLLCLLLAPFVPHMSEDLWRVVLGHERSVHLELWVKVKENWADSESALRQFGYDTL